MTNQKIRWNAKMAYLGGALVVIYASVLNLSFQFQLDNEDTQSRPILLVLSLLSAAFAIYLFACFWTYWAFPSTSSSFENHQKNQPGDRWPLIWIFLFGAIFRLLLVFSNPIQEVDIYRYIIDGATVCAGFDPYTTTPVKIAAAREPGGLPDTDFAIAVSSKEEEIRLARMVSSRPGLEHALNYVHFQQYTTPYPPVSQAVFAVAMKTVPADAGLNRYLITMKLAIVLFDLATAFLVVLLLSHLNLPLPWVIVYCWCPLTMKEFANSGHLDSIVVFLVTAAILATVKAFWPKGNDAVDDFGNNPAIETKTVSPRFFWLFLSALLLALAVGAKIFPVILFPLWCFACLKRGRVLVAVVAPLVLVVLSAVVLWPMIRQMNETKRLGHKLAPALVAAPDREQIDTGIEAFAKYWEMNDLLFMLVVENLRPDEVLAPNTRKAWFVVLPNGLRNQITDHWLAKSKKPRIHAAFGLTRWLMGGVFVGLALFFCIRFWRQATSQIWLEMAFLTVAWFWFLAPTQNPWYWTWALPLLVFARSRIWFLVSGVTLAYYLRFYFEYHHSQEGVWGSDLVGTNFFDFVVPWIEFGPVLMLLCGDVLFNCLTPSRRRRLKKE